MTDTFFSFGNRRNHVFHYFIPHSREIVERAAFYKKIVSIQTKVILLYSFIVMFINIKYVGMKVYRIFNIIITKRIENEMPV